MTDSARPDQTPPDSTIIDAEAEPLPKPPSALARLGRWLLIIVIAAAGCVAIAAGYHFYTLPATSPAKPAIVNTAPLSAAQPDAGGAELARQVQELERRLAALSASLERLQQLPAAPGPQMPGADPAQAERLKSLEETLQAQLAQQAMAASENRKASTEALRLAEAALSGQSQFDQKLADLARARAADLRQPVALLLAWQALRDKAARGSGFAAEANAVAGLLGQAAPLRTAFDAVQALAVSGAPTESALAGNFAGVAEAQQREAASLPPADGAAPPPWWQRALDKLAGLVTIRRVGGSAAEPGDQLAQAETLLQRADLAGAVAALNGLNAGPTLAAWRSGAEARLKLDAALEKMQQTLRDHFAATAP